MPVVLPRKPSKKCTVCNTYKLLANFCPLKGGKFGVHSWCRVCLRASRQTEEELNRLRMFRAERKSFVEHLKDKPCADCGGTFPPVCMDFDHRDPSIKHKTIAQAMYGNFDALLAEIEKCDLVCANCHRIRTVKGWENGTIKTTGRGKPRIEDIT